MAQLERAFSYDEIGNPVMVIYKRLPKREAFNLKKRQIEGYVIDMNDAWMFSRDHYPASVKVFYGYNDKGVALHGYRVLTYDEAMFAKCEELCIQFDLGLVTIKKMADIASMIEDGIGDLLSMPPQAPDKRQAIGEAIITMRDNDGGKIEKTIDIT